MLSGPRAPYAQRMTHPGDPMALFREAFERAKAREPFEANAMSLATVDAEGRPSVRMVLLKEADQRGFVFFTNYGSRKARELDGQGVAALCLHWPKGEEQVRVEGEVERVSDEESDAYFATRHPESQLGAWASRQSEALDERATLEARVEAMRTRFAGAAVPRPPHWGGYRVVPRRIELWQGKPSRLHERHVYERDGEAWSYRLLYP